MRRTKNEIIERLLVKKGAIMNVDKAVYDEENDNIRVFVKICLSDRNLKALMKFCEENELELGIYGIQDKHHRQYGLHDADWLCCLRLWGNVEKFFVVKPEDMTRNELIKEVKRLKEKCGEDGNNETS